MSGARYPLRTLAEVVGGTLVGHIGEASIEHLLIDSRNATITPTTLFIALRGPRHDGHRYINELIARGVQHFLVIDQPEASLIGRANFIRVPDTLVALQQLAAWHRSHFSYPVIGITGSNGKTVVKEWLYQLLRHDERIVRSPGSWNSQVGVPLSVWQMGAEHTLGIFEAGISKPGEMEQLEAMIRPTMGVLTNIGDAHDEAFAGDSAAKTKEKCALFRRAQVVVHRKADDRANVIGSSIPSSMVRCGISSDGSDAFLRVQGTEMHGDACDLAVVHQGSKLSFRIPFNDPASVANAETCIAVLLNLGKSASWIDTHLLELSPVDMRLRTMQGRSNTTLIDDSYSNDVTSLSVALQHLQRVAHGRRTVLVLSDIAESGLDEEHLYRAVAELLTGHGVDQLIAVGPRIGAQRQRFPAGARYHPSTATFLANEDPAALSGATVLIKGARTFGFERIVQRWQQHLHGTELEVALEAVQHNLNHYRALVGPSVRTMAMVKAFGYGTGALELARLFAHEQVAYLGVAYADEGIELRQQGITTPIMVMNPEPVAMETLHRFDLEPEVYDLHSLQTAIDYVRTAGSGPSVHIKLDTGMHRLGFEEAELPQLVEGLRSTPQLKVASILSHMVASDDPQHDDFTRNQIATFERMAQTIGGTLGYRPLWHMANSAGISRWPSAHFDMVRLGIGLHGIGTDAKETAALQHSTTLRTVIAQLKVLRSGDSVGYNRAGKVDGDRVIATLPIGYADGFSRRLGNGIGRVWINGKPAPTIGNVCMDMCMVDVTGIACTVGDEAIVFDASHPITELALDLGTIAYEVLTSIAQRVKRVYVGG